MSEFTKAAQALSDETRVRILHLILARECCVCEVMQALSISHTRASRNLKVLYDAGFLNLRTDGLYTLYSLITFKDNQFFSALVCAVESHIKSNPEAKRDLARLAEAKRTGSSRAPELKPAPNSGACRCQKPSPLEAVAK
jgi:ArsR family transcriptional regulator, arsenate/arsenite/antimonite-responsive transcriptional repressor